MDEQALKRTQHRSADAKITVEALRYYVPLFQLGEEAERALLETMEELTPAERNRYQTLLKLKQLATLKIAELGKPLITREINKLIASSHLRGREDLFDILYYAGLDGMKRGLRRFDVEKMNASSTNYLFQWIVTYAKKELVALEAPFGIPPSRFQRYKKISAVRKRMSETMGRYVTNEEVYEYFQGGKADLDTMNGRLANKGKPSKANLAIDMKLIQEQETFEKDMLNVSLIDPLDPQGATRDISEEDATPFSETIFGVFLEEHRPLPEARQVLLSMLSPHSMNDEEIAAVRAMPPRDYKRVSEQWTQLIKDPQGVFYRFLQAHQTDDFQQFDVRSTLRAIEAQTPSSEVRPYDLLFPKRRNS